MSLDEELERIAAGSGATAVLAAEPQPGDRLYLCAYAEGGVARSWIVLDADGVPVADRRSVRDAVTILALCEIAEDAAAGGDLDDLLSRLAAVRLTEDPPGIEDAEEAARELQRVLGTPPVLATPERLERIGAATRRLELALGGAVQGSPFAAAMRGATEVVAALLAEVEGSYRVPFATV